MAKIYDFKALTSKGKEIDFSQFQGKAQLLFQQARDKQTDAYTDYQNKEYRHAFGL